MSTAVIVVGEAEEAPDLLVEALVVLEHALLVRVPGLIQPMLRIEEAPETVMDAVGAHLDHEEEIPGPRLEKVLGHAEAPRRHFLDLLEQRILLVGAKVVHVDHVAADELFDLRLELRRMRELARRGVGREEAGDHRAVDLRDRIGLRDADDDHRPAAVRQQVPHAGHTHGARIREGERFVRVVAPVAEAVEAERARTTRGCHHRPGRHGDRRLAAPEDAVGAPLGQRAKVGEGVEPAVEHPLRRSAVEPDDEGFGGHLGAILAARSSRSACPSPQMDDPVRARKRSPSGCRFRDRQVAAPTNLGGMPCQPDRNEE